MEKLTDDYYEFIGVVPNATDKEIKDACNKLLKKYHPDKCKDVWANGITKRIFEIKATLLNSDKRKEYDEKHCIKQICCMTPLSIGFNKVPKENYHDWLKTQCKRLHEQIKKDGKYGYRFFSGSTFMYVVKFHHDDTYDVYKMHK
jgi:curved DNA-binding protein CbpA